MNILPQDFGIGHAENAATLTNLKISSGWWCNFTILKNYGVRQWVSDDIPSMKWKIKDV
jgi:hypothetical protein